MPLSDYSFFFFNDTATTEIYTLSLHDALPISSRKTRHHSSVVSSVLKRAPAKSSGLEQYGHCSGHRYVSSARSHSGGDRKSTRLNSSHGYISYAVFCLKKKKKKK